MSITRPHRRRLLLPGRPPSIIAGERRHLMSPATLGILGGQTTAFPVVQATASGLTDGSGTGTDPVVVNLPSGIVSGDLLIICLNIVSHQGGNSPTTPSGWTVLFNVASTERMIAYYKVADGMEGSTINIDMFDSRPTNHFTFRITGYQGTPEAATASGSSANNPPSITPSWPTTKMLVLTFAMAAQGDVTISAGPSGYTNFTVLDAGGGDQLAGAAARKEVEAASEDPGAFTFAAMEDESRKKSATVAIRSA